MGNLLDILILVAIGAVTLTLGMGIYSLYRGGDFGRTWSNKLMRLRIVLQALTIVLLVTGMWWKSQHGG